LRGASPVKAYDDQMSRVVVRSGSDEAIRSVHVSASFPRCDRIFDLRRM